MKYCFYFLLLIWFSLLIVIVISIINSDNAVKCYGVNTKGENPFVVMEYFSNGILYLINLIIK